MREAVGEFDRHEGEDQDLAADLEKRGDTGDWQEEIGRELIAPVGNELVGDGDHEEQEISLDSQADEGDDVVFREGNRDAVAGEPDEEDSASQKNVALAKYGGETPGHEDETDEDHEGDHVD